MRETFWCALKRAARTQTGPDLAYYFGILCWMAHGWTWHGPWTEAAILLAVVIVGEEIHHWLFRLRFGRA